MLACDNVTELTQKGSAVMWSGNITGLDWIGMMVKSILFP